MKKKYITPQIKVCKLDNVTLMAGSNIGGSESPGTLSKGGYWDEEYGD